MTDRDLALIRIGTLARALYGDSVWGETEVVGPVPFARYRFTVPNKSDLGITLKLTGQSFVRMETKEVRLKKWLWTDGTSVWLGYHPGENVLVYSFDEVLFPDEEGK